MKTIQRNQVDPLLSITQFRIEACCNCNVQFAITVEHYDRLKKTKESFYCPNGHRQAYTRSKEQELQEQLERAKRNLAWQTSHADQTRAECHHLKHKLSAQKANVTKLKKRISNGVCICCNRHFADLHAHMKMQHPDFSATDQAE